MKNLNTEASYRNKNSISTDNSVENINEAQNLISNASLRSISNAFIKTHNNINSACAYEYLAEVKDGVLNSTSTSYLASASYLISSTNVISLLSREYDDDLSDN